MHLLTILAFAVVFWRAEEPGAWSIVGQHDVVWTLSAVLAQPFGIALTTWWTASHARRLLERHGRQGEVAQRFHYWACLILQTVILAAFAATVLLTRWAAWFDFNDVSPALQIAGDLIVFTLFAVTLLVFWAVIYPLEQVLHGHGPIHPVDDEAKDEAGWRFRPYLDFHVRHYLLVVAVPMSLILFAANMTRGYAMQLQEWAGWIWAPDLLLALMAVGVFIIAPVMLRRIWRTSPLPSGPTRERLESVCERIGFRCREILVWNSGGVMVNAAVMGFFAPVRYVLLSDALLDTMAPEQIEAVFGHEVGHVKHRHLQHYLVFAVVGWVLVAGVMELLALGSIEPHAPLDLTIFSIQAIGMAVTVIYWGIGFGWLSRRFERQADLFGAYCATPDASECLLPCAVHPDARATRSRLDRVCATGAARFASALERVAALNGIPHEERSWRHSSLGSRIRFLSRLAGDPNSAEAFLRLIRRVKIIMLVIAVVGCIASAVYWGIGPEPAILRMESGGP